MKKAVDDETVSKLSFFSYVASLEPYLRKYQCDKPVIVFMFKDLRKVFLSLLRIIVKVSVMTGKTVQQLRETDKDENLLPLKDLESMRKPNLKRFKSLLKLLFDLNILSATQCDQATQEFQTFMDENVKMKTAFSSFDGLDRFYFKIIIVNRFEVLSFILKIIFTVSHGQASVERRFSLNDSVNQTNIAPEIIISKASD